MLDNQRISVIILAGGKSQRMGQDKAVLKLPRSQETLLEHTIKLAEQITQQILIVTSKRKVYHAKYPVLHDIIPHIGPLGGLYTGLSIVSTVLSLVLPVDMPLLNLKIISRLLAAVEDEYTIIIARHGRFIEPLVGIYPRAALPVIETMIKNKDYKLHSLFRYTATVYVDFPDSKPFLNINTQSDLRELLKLH